MTDLVTTKQAAIIEAVRSLHAPSEPGQSYPSWAQCEGCDHDGSDAEPPEWPCRTAELVYTAAEVGEVRAWWTEGDQAHREQMRNDRAARDARLSTRTAGVWDEVVVGMERAVAVQMTRFIEFTSADLTAKSSITLPISRELVDI